MQMKYTYSFSCLGGAGGEGGVGGGSLLTLLFQHRRMKASGSASADRLRPSRPPFAHLSLHHRGKRLPNRSDNVKKEAAALKGRSDIKDGDIVRAPLPAAALINATAELKQ